MNIFTRMSKNIRIIGDQDNQFPDQWSSAVEVNIYIFFYVCGHFLLFIISIVMIEFCGPSYLRTVQRRVS
jgi:hypothetical protein